VSVTSKPEESPAQLTTEPQVRAVTAPASRPRSASAPQQAAPPDAPQKPTGGQQNWAMPLAVLIVGTFMSVLDISIVNIAIPKMQTALNASSDNIEWVVTGYTLVLGIVVPLTGWLGLRIGLTRLYVLALLGFSLGSALCGLAWNLESILVFRAIQAIPGGVLPVTTLTMLYQIVPRERMGSAMGLYGLGVVVAPAIGPTLGGYLVEYYNWRLIFFINVPIGILGCVAALMVFPQIKPSTWPKLDVLGFVTIAYALFAVLLAFSKGEDWGWTGYRILGLFVTAAISLALFLIIENEVESPLISLEVFRYFPFCLSLVLISITMTGLFSALYFLPQFLQQVQGLQELDSGLVLLPAALVMAVCMPIAGRLYDAIGPRYPVMIGLVLVGYGSWLLGQMTVDTPRGDIEMWLCVRNLGVGLAMMPIMTSGTSSLAQELTAAGSSVNNLVQRLVSSVAVAVFGSMNAMYSAQLDSDRGGQMGQTPYASHTIAGSAGIPVTDPTKPVLGGYQALQQQVTTQTYANGFVITAWLSAVGVLLAVFMRAGKQSSGGQRAAVEV
jgi:EmrB/QacA subfamily drug resistance transporter